MRRLKTAVTAAVITAIPASAVSAHGIWFAQRARQTAMIYGIGADDLDMVKRMPLVESIGAYDADYRPVKAALRVAILQNGTWSRKGEGAFEKKGRDEMPDAALSEQTVRYDRIEHLATLAFTLGHAPQ